MAKEIVVEKSGHSVQFYTHRMRIGIIEQAKMDDALHFNLVIKIPDALQITGLQITTEMRTADEIIKTELLIYLEDLKRMVVADINKILKAKKKW